MNNRVQLQRAQILNYYQESQTIDTLNPNEMNLPHQIWYDCYPKSFSQLYTEEPACYFKLQRFYGKVRSSFNKCFYTEVRHKNISNLNTKLIALKQESVQVLKEFSSFNRFAFKMIIEEYLKEQNGLVNKNKQILDGISENKSPQDLDEKIIDQIYKSKISYRRLSKIKKTWQKFFNFLKKQNRQHYEDTKLILITIYNHQIHFLYAQKFMKYLSKISEDLNIVKQKNLIEKAISNMFQIKNKDQFINIKKKLQKMVYYIKICQNHNGFSEIIKHIEQKLIEKIRQYSIKIQNRYNLKNKHLLNKLLLAQTNIMNLYSQLNEKVLNLEKQSQKQQKIKQIIEQNYKYFLLPDLKILFAINQQLLQVEYQLAKQQKEIQLCYEFISQMFRNENKFYVHSLQKQIVQPSEDFTFMKIQQNQDFESTKIDLTQIFKKVKNQVQKKSRINKENQLIEQ